MESLQVGWWFKPWFYQHAETALKRGEFVEYIPTREYYHRHTRCIYWEGKLILPFADQLWFRWLFGWMMPPKVSFLKATQVCFYNDIEHLNIQLFPLFVSLTMLTGVDITHKHMMLCYNMLVKCFCIVSGNNHVISQWSVQFLDHGHHIEVTC
jgi:hypothetical protein